MLGQRRFGKLQTAVLIVIALVMGANLISPAVAHVTRRLNHLYKHLDPRYVNTNETAGGDLSGPHANLQIGANAVHASEFGNATVTVGPAVPIANNTVVSATLNCPAGTRMLSGGALKSGAGPGMLMQENHPDTTNQWSVEYWNITGAPQTFNVIVHCLQA
jgi:hypothetical protein